MRCHSCLVESTNIYCHKCIKELFAGKNVSGLNFDKQEFYQKRKEFAKRISISGVQDKLSLKFNENDELISTDTKGIYILKPATSDEQIDNSHDICANEHLSMQISKQIFKIPTASCALIPFSTGELAYITKRFDYAKNGDKLDQEDFAAVLEYTSDKQGKNYKYESSYESCAKAIQKYIPASIPALEDFYKRIVMNYLIGNADAHLKNFSLYRAEGRKDRSLTPNYDLLYTRYHIPNEEGYMGLDLFENELNNPTKAFEAMGYYTLEDFELFANKIGIKEIRLEKIFKLILSNTEDIMKMIEHSFLSDSGKKAYRKNYEERLRLHLCYSIKQYNFSGKMQKCIDKFLKNGEFIPKKN
jgi:serine/threonine-protein kinase HipA